MELRNGDEPARGDAGRGRSRAGNQRQGVATVAEVTPTVGVRGDETSIEHGRGDRTDGGQSSRNDGSPVVGAGR